MADDSRHSLIQIRPKPSLVFHNFLNEVINNNPINNKLSLDYKKIDESEYLLGKTGQAKRFLRDGLNINQPYPTFTFIDDLIWSSVDKTFQRKVNFDLFLIGNLQASYYVSLCCSEIPLLSGLSKYGSEYMDLRPIRFYFLEFEDSKDSYKTEEICQFPLIGYDKEISLKQDKVEEIKKKFNIKVIDNKNRDIYENSFGEQEMTSEEIFWVENDYFEIHTF